MTPKEQLIEEINRKIKNLNVMLGRGVIPVENCSNKEWAYNQCLKLIEEILP